MTPDMPQPDLFSLLNAGWSVGWINPTAAGAPTHTPHAVAAWKVLAVAAVVIAGIYVARIIWWPFGVCHRCNNRAFLTDKSGKHARMCPRCHGTRPLRIGRRILNHIIATRRAAR